jgi:phosphatidylglycerol:prolipoprotein diacylglycerol transferase
LHPLLFHLGHLAIPTYGALIAIALVAALAALTYFARRLALDPNKLWNLGLIGILTALITARLLLVAEFFSAFREHPFWVLGLGATLNPWNAIAAALIGLAAVMLYALAEGLPLLRVLDCMAPAAALALSIASPGAFLAGADYGLPTGTAWAVTYASPVSAFWYHTPLGVRLYPVQLYEALASLAIFLLLSWWLPHRRQNGELAGAWLFLYGIAGFFLGFYRAADRTNLLVHQTVFFVMVIASAPLLLRRESRK